MSIGVFYPFPVRLACRMVPPQLWRLLWNGMAVKY